VKSTDDSGFLSLPSHSEFAASRNSTVGRKLSGISHLQLASLHEPEPTEEEHSTDLERPQVGKCMVIQFGVSIILLALTFAMAQSSHVTLRNYTWSTLDNIINIFLAVLVFQVMDEILVDLGVVPPGVASVGSVIYALACLFTVIGLSYYLKHDLSDLGIFAAASAHFVSFAFMHSVLVNAEHVGTTLIHTVILFVVLCAALPVVYYLCNIFRKKLGLEGEEVEEKLDDLENDAGAMGLAICWTLIICFAISGEYQDVEEQEKAQSAERRLMLVYAIFLSVGAFTFLVLTAKKVPDDYYEKRAFNIFSSFLAMCVAWAFLLWGKWHFHDHAYAHVPVFGRIVFASVASLVTMAIIVGLSISIERGSIRRQANPGHMLILTALGLLVAWSWEEVFDKSIEVLLKKLKTESPEQSSS
jgi:hypothetical protein